MAWQTRDYNRYRGVMVFMLQALQGGGVCQYASPYSKMTVPTVHHPIDRSAYGIMVPLSHIYFYGVVIELFIGGIVTARVLYVFLTNYKKLNSVVKSYMSVIIPDIFMVVNFMPRDFHNLRYGYLTTGPWCRLSAFVAIMAITALNSGAVCVAYSTYRMVIGDPMNDQLVIYWNIFSWSFGVLVAAIFLIGDLLGPYKGLYCCVKETRYRAYAVAPVILITFTSIFLMSYLYYSSYEYIKGMENKRAGAAGGEGAKASSLIMKRGIILVTSFYGCWSVMIANGFLTSVGVQVDVHSDVLAAWLSKLMPLVDSVILLQMLEKIVSRGKGGDSKGNKSSASE